jgi:hypothetical protein
MAKKFYTELEQLQKKLQQENIQAEPNYVTIEEFQHWIIFLVEFTQTFFNYRINMIKVVKLVMRKLDIKNIEANTIEPGIYNSRIGKITVYSKKDFDNLSGNEIQKISKDIMNKTLDKYFGLNRLPVYIFAFKNAETYKILSVGEPGVMGIAFPLMSGPQIDTNNINRLRDISNSDRIEGNESDIANRLIKYDRDLQKSNVNQLIPEGSIILVDGNIYKAEKAGALYKVLIKLITPSVFYYGFIVHETIHTIQTNDIKNNFKNIKNIQKGYMNNTYSDIRNLDRNTNIIHETQINANYGLQSYLLNNREAESMIEQRNFILSIKRNPIIEKLVKFNLFNMNFIHKV